MSTQISRRPSQDAEGQVWKQDTEEKYSKYLMNFDR